MTAKHTGTLRLLVGHRPARIQIPLRRVARDAQRPGNPLCTPTRLPQPNDRRDRFRLQHLLHSANHTAHRIHLNVLRFQRWPPCERGGQFLVSLGGQFTVSPDIVLRDERSLQARRLHRYPHLKCGSVEADVLSQILQSSDRPHGPLTA